MLSLCCSDLTEATLAGASISVIAAVTIVLLLVLVSPRWFMVGGCQYSSQ